MRLPFVNPHPHEDISAYADGELTLPRIPALESHLASCAACRSELESIRAMQSQFAALPEVDAPRSFALTPQMAQRPVVAEPARVRQPSQVAAFSNGMRLAGAGMSLALVIVLVLNFSGGGSSGNDNSAAPVALNQQPAADAVASASAEGSSPKTIDIPTQSATFDTNQPEKSEGSAGGVGSVGSAPNAASTPGAPPDASLTNGSTYSTVAAGALASGAPADVPALVGAVPGSTDNQSRSSADSAVTAAPAQDAANSTSVNTDSGSSMDTMLIIALALAAGVTLLFAGSWLLPRLARDGS